MFSCAGYALRSLFCCLPQRLVGRQPLCSFSCNTICPGPAFPGYAQPQARRITKTPHTKSTHCWNTMKHASICWNSSSGVKPSHPLQSACMACQPMRTAKPYRTCSARSTKQASRSMPWSIYFSASSDAVSRPCVARLFSRSFNSSIKVLISPNWRYTDAKRT